jgi:hypothetical protein
VGVRGWGRKGRGRKPEGSSDGRACRKGKEAWKGMRSRSKTG